MMARVSMTLAVAGAVFCCLSYVLYVPLHPDIQDQGQVRFLVIMCRVLKNIANTGEMLGISTLINMARFVSSKTLGDGLPPHIHGLKIDDTTFAGTPVRIYTPHNASGPSPCVLYIHGGGWALLSVDIYDDIVTELALKTGYVFVSIDYRLSPEHPFPIPFYDCLNATIHLLEHARHYGIDQDRIAIAGDSAGGNLAAAVAQRVTERSDLPGLRFQWLIYPALQAFNFRLPSFITNQKAAPYFLEWTDVIHFWCFYIGIYPTPEVVASIMANNHTSLKTKSSTLADYVDQRHLPVKYHRDREEPTEDKDLVEKMEGFVFDPDLAPLMRLDLSSVPPAFIVTAEYDVLRDEGMLYARRLKQQGVEVELYNAPHSIHGFMIWSQGLAKYSNTDEVTHMFVKYAEKHMT